MSNKDDNISEKSFNERDFGGSLVSVIILIAIIGVVAFVTSQQFVNEFTAQEALDRRVSKMAIFEYVRSAIDCETVKFNYPTCPATGFVELASHSMGLTVAVKLYDQADPTNATRIGSYNVRARCFDPKTGDNKSIYIEASPMQFEVPVWSRVNPNVFMGCRLL